MLSKIIIILVYLFVVREDLFKIIRISSGISREKTVCVINKVGFFFRIVENEFIIFSFDVFIDFNLFFFYILVKFLEKGCGGGVLVVLGLVYCCVYVFIWIFVFINGIEVLFELGELRIYFINSFSKN